MGKTCPACGSSVFVGELRCPSCKATIPGAADEARAAGINIDDRSGPARPEGLQQIVDKGVADQDSWRDRDTRYNDPYDLRRDDDDAAITFGQVDASLSDTFRVERDRHGNVQWDLKYALVGAVVVAVFIAVFVWWFLINAESVTGSSFVR